MSSNSNADLIEVSEVEDSILPGNDSKLIECVNFTLGDDITVFTELMGDLVYSPSGRFAVSIKISQEKVESLFILDPFNMQFHQYQNSSEQILNMELLYWIGEDCLVFLHTKKKKLYQTPILLDHIAKTYEPMSTVTHSLPDQLPLDIGSTREVKNMQIKGIQYVLLVCEPRHRLWRYIYAIPYKPDVSIPYKTFMSRYYLTNLQRPFYELLSMDLFVFNNEVYFPVRFHCDNEFADAVPPRVMDLWGDYLVYKYDEIPEVPQNAVSLAPYIKSNVRRRGRLVTCHPETWDGTPEEELSGNSDTCTKMPGTQRIVNGNLVALTKEKTDKTDEYVSSVGSVDLTKLTVTTIYEEKYLQESELSISLTPFNILVATKVSSTQISCRIIPYPCGFITTFCCNGAGNTCLATKVSSTQISCRIIPYLFNNKTTPTLMNWLYQSRI